MSVWTQTTSYARRIAESCKRRTDGTFVTPQAKSDASERYRGKESTPSHGSAHRGVLQIRRSVSTFVIDRSSVEPGSAIAVTASADRHAEQRVVAKQGSSSREHGVGPRTPAVPARVLVVDQEAATRQGLADLLRWWGFAVESARNGEGGLAMVTRFRPAVVLAALTLSRLNGLELLQALADHLRELAFVLITERE